MKEGIRPIGKTGFKPKDFDANKILKELKSKVKRGNMRHDEVIKQLAKEEAPAEVCECETYIEPSEAGNCYVCGKPIKEE
jgi:uncharacterized protein (DUF885 family)